MNERCRRICGGSEKRCFISNRGQLRCIADMVLNKVAATEMVLESVLQDRPESAEARAVAVALKSLDELVAWTKFLQIAHDLRETIDIITEERPSENRKERRYPLSEIYQKYVELHIRVEGETIPVQLVNFSCTGMQIRSPGPLEAGLVVEGMLCTERHPIKKEALFFGVVRHCSGTQDAFHVGIQITGTQDDSSLNFFKSVHDFIVMSLPQEP